MNISYCNHDFYKMTSRSLPFRKPGEHVRACSLTERLRGVLFQVLWPHAIPQPRPIAVTMPRTKAPKKRRKATQPRH